MTTQQPTLSLATASNSGEDDDIGTLIYRERQLRKKEAAASARVAVDGTHLRHFDQLQNAVLLLLLLRRLLFVVTIHRPRLLVKESL